MPSRVALYARYSSDLQRDASIEDQLRICREHAARHGWTVVDSYTDRAISGASMRRPGIQDLITDAASGRFDIILTEAMDRISRDQEDIAGFYKRMEFAGIKLVTISEGELGAMHIGLKGTMNALYLKDLAQKTHRGLQGKIQAGKSAGGNAYGYRVVRGFRGDGTPIPGDREIIPEEAEIVRRIFRDFSNGLSPRAIAHALNKEGIPGPSGVGWGQSTINGNAERGTGILNNELYIGRLVWNRLRYIKAPNTGKRISRPNPPKDWVITDVPALRIIDDELWQAVKTKQNIARRISSTSTTPTDAKAPKAGFWLHQRPKHLLTGLMRCGQCGGGYVKISATMFGCAAARNKGTCENRLNIRADHLDEIVLTGLQDRLMNPDVFKEFMDAFIAERNTVIAQQNAHFTAAEAELSRVKSRQKVLVQALMDGMPARTVKDEMIALEAREDDLKALLAARPVSEPSLHPNLANIYRDKVAVLHKALGDPPLKDEAFNAIRTLIEEIRLIPENGELHVEIRGALAGILALCASHKKTAGIGTGGLVSVLASQMKLVAGARFERAAFRL
ncbi:MAG: resolvase [Acidiphilium sp. 20-67-58]|uniref:recombinase family protein n=1 Tax=Acidiphilium sp. 20-67-58 TaxID=1970291 RepID=UPI000BC689A0|nr:recombinase family protein [Acidiphilium sp. 20-67-58]OYV54680.1 MAG: resolvase [Acidiphilium sp. 20-67-58]HQT65665.1 recombinase family protein [Acidocella sp.]